MKIVLALALLGHILCGVCDCLLSYSPSGRIDLAGVLKDAKKMREEFKALPLSWPMASILLGVAAITMFGFGYLELSKWMGTFSHTASTIMYISSIVFLTNSRKRCFVSKPASLAQPSPEALTPDSLPAAFQRLLPCITVPNGSMSLC